MKKVRYFIVGLFVTLMATSTPIRSEGGGGFEMPDLSVLAEFGDWISENLDFGDVGAIASEGGDLITQGVEGVSSAIDTVMDSEIMDGLMSAAGGIATEFVQKQHWGWFDEMSYGLIHDFLDPAQMFDCLDYMIVGACMSVRWTMFGPKFTTGFAVEHYVRDVHVEVVPFAPMEDPLGATTFDSVLPSSQSMLEDLIMMYPFTWRMTKLLGELTMIGGVGSAVLSAAPGQTIRNERQRYLYSDAQVSGNIERVVYDTLARSTIGMFGYCDSPTLPAAVYYNSSLDQFSWRWLATTESVLTALYQASSLAWNDVGRSYGSTFPRTGYQESNNRFKTSVVSAIRATNIAAENRMQFSGLAGLHIYLPLPEFAAGSFTESDYKTPQTAETFKLDMIYPYRGAWEGQRCTRYGADEGMFGNLSIEGQLEDDGYTSQFVAGNGHNTAAMKLYRPFRCCRKNGSKVYSIVAPGPIGTP